MCGMFGHGFYWENRLKEYEVVFDFEINSHSRIKKYRQIPQNAHRIGFDPVNGEPVSNELEALPEAVKEKIRLVFQMYFPNKEAISNWIKKNYAKNDDKEEWDLRLLEMLQTEGVAKWLGGDKSAEESKQYAEVSKRCAEESKWYAERSKQYAEESKRCAEGSKRFAEESKWYAKVSKRYAESVNIAQNKNYQELKGIEGFITAFMEFPNDYWATRNIPQEVEYRSFVRV